MNAAAIRAIAKAARLAAIQNDVFYVVFEDGYNVASQYDMDTYFHGADPLYSVDPEGNIE